MGLLTAFLAVYMLLQTGVEFAKTKETNQLILFVDILMTGWFTWITARIWGYI